MDYRESFIHHIRKRQQGNGLSVAQKSVLQRRRNYLADQLEEDADTLIINMRDKQLIDDETFKSVKEEKSPSGQVTLLIELLAASPNTNAFEEFMEMLTPKYEDIVNELRREVKYEEGVEGVSDVVAKEAATLVHKKFGTSKRWGEGDKKDITDLLAVTMELQNEDWQAKIQSTENKVTQLQATLHQKETKITELTKKLKHFIQIHNNQLTNHAHGMVTTKQHLAEVFDNPKKDTLTKLEEATTGFLQRTDQILYHRDMLMEERAKCLTMLNVKDDRKGLDRVVKEKLTQSQESSNTTAKGEVNQNDDNTLKKKVTTQADDIRQLNKRITNMEEMLEQKTEIIKSLQQAK